MDSEISHELYKVTPWVNAIEFLFNYRNEKGGKLDVQSLSHCSHSLNTYGH